MPSVDAAAEIDRCEADGLWFDGHELTLVVQACISQHASARTAARDRAEAALREAAASIPADDPADTYLRGAFALLQAFRR